jgi:RimJ/RimL family protein N-acetyltransferase
MEINGKYVTLRYVDLCDAEDIIKLRNDSKLNRYLSSQKPLTIEDQINWLLNNKNSETNHYFKIVRKKDDKFIGTISLYNINNNEGDFGRYICIDPIGAIESELLIIEFAFLQRRLAKIYTKVITENEKVIIQHRKFGFEDREVVYDHNINRNLLIQELSYDKFKNFDYSSIRNLIDRFAVL